VYVEYKVAGALNKFYRTRYLWTNLRKLLFSAVRSCEIVQFSLYSFFVLLRVVQSWGTCLPLRAA